jgi:hypothetical protein
MGKPKTIVKNEEHIIVDAQLKNYDLSSEKDFLNSLGKRLKKDEFNTKPGEQARFHSELSRLELLQIYLYLCQEVRVVWNKRALKHQVVPLVIAALEQEQQSVDAKARRKN